MIDPSGLPTPRILREPTVDLLVFTGGPSSKDQSGSFGDPPRVDQSGHRIRARVPASLASWLSAYWRAPTFWQRFASSWRTAQRPKWLLESGRSHSDHSHLPTTAQGAC
jgi:hypothetical protein